MKFKKGHTPWNKGKKMNDEFRKKVSESLKRQYVFGIRDRYQITKKAVETIRKKGQPKLKGKPSWIKGKTKETCEAVRRISLAKLGEKNPMYGKRGELHPRYKGFSKNYIKHVEWNRIKKNRIKKLIKIRDSFTCQACGVTEKEQIDLYGQPLQVHHIIPYEICKEHKPDNLITLCSKCHGLCKNQDFNDMVKLKLLKTIQGD
jgi:5-methylcytosine-specific restriction endonuclease McrA